MIKDQKVIGVYDDLVEAYNETRKTEEKGSFIVPKCAKDLSELVLTYQGNVAVA